MSVDTKYINAAQQRILKTLMLLAGHELDGVAPSEVAVQMKSDPSKVTRDLANLREAGLAERLESGRWVVTPRFGQQALKILNALNRVAQRLEETQQRFTRNS